MSMQNRTLTWANAAFCAAFALATTSFAHAQSQAAITLEPNPVADHAITVHAGSTVLATNYRGFGNARVGQSSERQAFTFTFHQSTRVTGFSATGDFRVVGGTCIEGHTYAPGDVCSVDVVFAPQGPGHRSGKLLVAHSASAQPMTLAMGGEAVGPVVSFIPANIMTVPGTYPGGVGLLKTPQTLAIDGGDNLYMADTGNSLIRYREAGGALSVIAGGGANSSPIYNGLATGVQLTNPYGLAVDYFGDLVISDTGASVVRVSTFYGSLDTIIGGGANSSTGCNVVTPCDATSISIPSPYGVALDASNHVLLDVSNQASSGFGAYFAGDIGSAGFAYLASSDMFSSTDYAFTVDGNDNVYFALELPANALPGVSQLCYIFGENQAYQSGSNPGNTWIVAGNKSCGFSGDGGLAKGAEISGNVQGFAWDAAGNFYFTDTGNQRVRRIDATTGIIRTVAGNGVSGYTGDGGAATSAELNSPTGIAVDSRGQVYVTSLAGSNGNAVVRETTATGRLSFPLQAIATHSAAKTILVSNTGNDALNFTQASFTSGNTGDFSIDSNTTTCKFTSPLPSGHSCYIGVIFTPAATGSRSATLTLLDDTVTGSNNIQLTGSGATPAQAVLSPTSITFPSQTQGTTSAAKAVTLKNTGGLPLTINSYSFTGTNPTYFAQAHTCGTTLAAGASCTINVTFKPLATGSAGATLTVATNGGSPTVGLTGSGTTIIVGKPIIDPLL